VSRKWVVLILILTSAYLLSFGWLTAARAKEAEPQKDSACRTCHEDRYWLYDTGKWYCLCGKQRDCIDCHGGDGKAWDANLAHEGMLINPIAENPAVCKDCHPDDYSMRIECFAAVAGIDLFSETAPTPPRYATAAQVNASSPASPLLQTQPKEPWQKVSIAFVGLLFICNLIFGYRCWRSDCLKKATSQ
jgi:hypothetical protein